MASRSSSSSEPYLSNPTAIRPNCFPLLIQKSVWFPMKKNWNKDVPVAEVVHAGDFPSTCSVEVSQESANDRRPQMSHMELFCDVGWGILCAQPSLGLIYVTKKKRVNSPKISFFPFPTSFWPYSGLPLAVSCVNWCTWLRTLLMNASVWALKWRNTPWIVRLSIHSSASN